MKPFKIFMSQPMNGLSDEQIHKNRAEAERNIRKEMGRDVHFIDSLIEDDAPSEVKNRPLWYLGVSIEMLAEADAAYFLDGWEDTRGCIMEHEACKLYGVDIIKD